MAIELKEFNQIEGIDFDITFSPILPVENLRMTIAIASLFNCSILQLDVKGAYINTELHNDIYMNLLEGH